jgi:hypothetical protein
MLSGLNRGQMGTVEQLKKAEMARDTMMAGKYLRAKSRSEKDDQRPSRNKSHVPEAPKRIRHSTQACFGKTVSFLGDHRYLLEHPGRAVASTWTLAHVEALLFEDY